MPISSLSKISVPGADGNSTSLLMPKLQYRFRVTLEGFGVSNGEVFELTKQVMDVTRPQVAFEPVTIDVYNSKAYLAGKPTWSPITLNLREDVDGRVQKLVGEQIQKQFDFMEQASANSGVDYKFTTRIEITDGGNGANGVNTLETFVLVGCFLNDVNYNTLAYNSNDPVTVTLAITYDNAVQTPFGDGIGVDVGRTLGSVITGGGSS